ncbi:N-acetyl sugar amidotransferase [Chitinophaga horti]|uniref:N-acetyl sugar amidotransferase n=1 Tax=Chitinophaga horti TaxID=2920382 RepID=A0ABY6IYG5_9BACT|nr:N-acetyl sugar amidotransferase [Chitinophaga horti]UYQ92423.1 N-acetyl sugar amidotransferase [Chitinophaga horti]
MQNTQQQCTKCVMDTTDPDIRFDAQGVCNYCLEAAIVLPKMKFTAEQEQENLAKIKQMVHSDANKYDCVIGLSGGVDSSYVALLAHKLGLKALCVHFDNGWNSEIAVSNIKKIVQKCNYDLATYVIDWPEFKDLQRSFFKAGVVDIEMLTDHAIMATMFQLRKKYKLKYILSGSNYVTEHGMPLKWIWRKQDLTNIRDIQSKFGTKKIKNFPTMNSVKFQLSKLFGLGGTYIEILNGVNYSKVDAMEALKREFGWEYYGGKHYESVFTKFYQAYILPTKFKFDKRKVHLSAQIRNGEITRDEALQELAKDIYDPIQLKNDRQYVLKKLGFSEEEFGAMMAAPPKQHLDYASDEWIFNIWRKLKGKKNA